MKMLHISSFQFDLPKTAPTLKFSAERAPNPENVSKWKEPPVYKKLWNLKYLAVLGLALLEGGLSLTHLKPPPTEKEKFPAISRAEEILNTPKRAPFLTAAFLLLLISLLGDHLSRSYRSAAYHEIGHLLTLYGSNSPFYSKEINLNEENPVMRIEPVSEQLLNFKNIDTLLWIQQGGAEMEKLKYGYAQMGCAWDKVQSLITVGYYLPIFLRHAPSDLRQFLISYFRKSSIVKDLLRQYDPKLIDELAQRLEKERVWNKEKIEALVVEFKLKPQQTSL